MKNNQILINHLLDSLPSLARRTLPWLPPIACQFGLERLFNQFFKTELATGALNFMHHKWVAIQVRDLNFQFSFSLVTHRGQPKLQVRQQRPKPELALAGEMEDLLLLMTQQVDPDTLFFRRRLTLTGDTELGLQLKNFLDTIELQSHLPTVVHHWSMMMAERLSQRHQAAMH